MAGNWLYNGGHNVTATIHWKMKWMLIKSHGSCNMRPVVWLESGTGIMMSSHGNTFHITGPLWGNRREPVDSPHKGPVTQRFDVFFVVSFNNLLNKQWDWQWFQMPWCSCDITVMDKISRIFMQSSPIIHYFLPNARNEWHISRPWSQEMKIFFKRLRCSTLSLLSSTQASSISDQRTTRPWFNINTIFPGMGIPIIICLTFIMGIPILVR